MDFDLKQKHPLIYTQNYHQSVQNVYKGETLQAIINASSCQIRSKIQIFLDQGIINQIKNQISNDIKLGKNVYFKIENDIYRIKSEMIN